MSLYTLHVFKIGPSHETILSLMKLLNPNCNKNQVNSERPHKVSSVKLNKRLDLVDASDKGYYLRSENVCLVNKNDKFW